LECYGINNDLFYKIIGLIWYQTIKLINFFISKR
jgi:hypothetical protein